MERVRNHRNTNNTDSSQNDDDVVVGSVEQNIFTPLLYQDSSLKLKAIASMFRTSPLCLASIAENDFKKNAEDVITVGAHEDTVSLLKRILQDDADKKYSVIASPRASKNTDLVDGKLDAIQAYSTTEVPTLERFGHGDGPGGFSVNSLTASTSFSTRLLVYPKFVLMLISIFGFGFSLSSSNNLHVVLCSIGSPPVILSMFNVSLSSGHHFHHAST